MSCVTIGVTPRQFDFNLEKGLCLLSYKTLTTDNLSIPLCVKQETVSLCPRRVESNKCGTMIVSFRFGRCRKHRFLHYSKRKDAENAVSLSKSRGVKAKTMYSTDSNENLLTETMFWWHKQSI